MVRPPSLPGSGRRPFQLVQGTRKATGEDDLVYLTVGERARVEVAAMPTIGKTIVFHDNRMTRLDHAGVDELTAEEWVEKMRLPSEP